MREQKFLAGLGTVLVFAGIYCFKALLPKQQTGHAGSAKQYPKAVLILGGCLFIAMGIWLVVKAFASV